jgi:ABC-type transporter Mla MlaB component
LTRRCRRDEEDGVTLRITREKGSGSRALLRLEGRLVAECAALLKRECFGVLRSRGAVSLDLAGVNFVDRAGVEALARLSRAGVEIRCRSGPVASVLEGEGIRVTRDADAVDDRRPSQAGRLSADTAGGGETAGLGRVQ